MALDRIRNPARYVLAKVPARKPGSPMSIAELAALPQVKATPEALAFWGAA